MRPRPPQSGTERIATEAVHGGPDLAELTRLGLDPDSILDFSTNVNPFLQPSARLRKVLAGVPPHRLPDPRALVLRQTLADRLGVGADNIFAGNGSGELIWLTALAFLREGDRALIVGPTYSEYARAVQLMGAKPHHCLGRAETSYHVTAADVAQALTDVQPRVVFVCNPNSPTGQSHPLGAVQAWSEAHRDALFVVDESYWDFGPRDGTAIDLEANNVLVLRSMTKAHGLAGLRLGFAVGPAAIVETLRRVAPPWNVNAPAQVAGVVVMAELERLAQSLSELARAKPALVDGLASLGLVPLPSSTHFFLVHVGDGAVTREALLRRGILVRDCASFGLPEFIRLSTQTFDANARLLDVLRETC
jgi:histidinol-phosphate aminotransferase